MNYIKKWYKINPAGNLNNAQAYQKNPKLTVLIPLTFNWKQQKSFPIAQPIFSM